MLSLLLWGLLLVAPARPAPLPGSAAKVVLIYSKSRYLEAPGVALDGGLPLASFNFSTPQACAQACLDADPDCGWFTTECSATQVCRCELFSPNCTLAPLVSDEAPATGVTVTSGVPLRYELPNLDIYAAEDGQAVLGADLPECPGSTLPGRCAFDVLVDATSACTQTKECAGITMYWQGLDGCNSTTLVLVGEALSGNNSFVSPLVSSFTKQYKPQDILLTAKQGIVIPPTAADAAAAAASSNPDSAWLGCIVAPNAAMAGTLVEVLDGVPSPLACCRACRAKGAGTANVWNFCASPGGCIYPLAGKRPINMKPGQCELRFNLGTSMAMGGFPLSVVAKGPQVPTIGGAPMTVTAGSLPGYEMHLGVTTYPTVGSFKCPESIRSEANDCLVQGSLQQLGAACDSIPQCVALRVKPGWMGLPEPQTIAIAKNETSEDTQQLNPNSIVYVNNTRLQLQAGGGTGDGSGNTSGSQPSQSSLSAGAIAGIAVGAAVVVLAAAGGGWVVLRRQRRQRTVGSKAGTAAEGFKTATEVASVGSAPPSTRGHSIGASTASAPAAPPAAGGTAVSACHIERKFNVGGPSMVSPFAAMASRGGSGAASPFALASVSQPSSAGAPAVPHSRPELGGGLASLAGLPPAAAKADGTSTPTSGSGSGGMLPELKAHVAAMDAGTSVGGVLAGQCGGMGGELLTELSLLAATSLPEALRDVLVDITELQPLWWPNGTLQELGTGASATVFKVLFRGEAVAAKEMEVGRDLGCQRSFCAEAERLHVLRHAHLVQLYGVCLSGSKGILLLEYCAGRDLQSALAVQRQNGRGRLFGWYAHGRRVALDVAKALNYLHHRNVVHLDIKSSNVLLTGTGTAKLGDVGLSRLQQGTALSREHLAVGTFAYMAPEMITHSRCTLAVDIFSMGVLLCEICTGERPQRGAMRLPRVPEECPQGVVGLISRCMALEPSERPTAQQVMQSLQALQQPDARDQANAGSTGVSSPAMPAES